VQTTLSAATKRGLASERLSESRNDYAHCRAVSAAAGGADPRRDVLCELRARAQGGGRARARSCRARARRHVGPAGRAVRRARRRGPVGPRGRLGAAADGRLGGGPCRRALGRRARRRRLCRRLPRPRRAARHARQGHGCAGPVCILPVVSLWIAVRMLLRASAAVSAPFQQEGRGAARPSPAGRELLCWGQLPECCALGALHCRPPSRAAVASAARCRARVTAAAEASSRWDVPARAAVRKCVRC